jgi:hypothetical protein
MNYVYLVIWSQHGEDVYVGICATPIEAENMCSSLSDCYVGTLLQNPESFACYYEEVPLFSNSREKTQLIYNYIKSELDVADAIYEKMSSLAVLDPMDDKLDYDESSENLIDQSLQHNDSHESLELA